MSSDHQVTGTYALKKRAWKFRQEAGHEDRESRVSIKPEQERQWRPSGIQDPVKI
jgi:hypothetical protein